MECYLLVWPTSVRLLEQLYEGARGEPRSHCRWRQEPRLAQASGLPARRRAKEADLQQVLGESGEKIFSPGLQSATLHQLTPKRRPVPMLC